MMPHPTTMSFAWEKDVLRGSQVLLLALGLMITVLLGGAVLVDHQAPSAPAVTAQQTPSSTHHSPTMAVEDAR
jgi:hypothetical protein